MKKREDKEMMEIERKARLNRTLETLGALVEKMDRKKDEMLEKARAAKLKGSQSSLNLAKVGLASALATRRRAEEMLMQLDIMASMKDIAGVTQDFLSVVSDTCGDIMQFTKNNHFGKVNKEVTKAFAAMNAQSESLDLLMESSTFSFDAMNMGISDDLNSEIDALISGQAAASEDAMDDEITQKIERLKRME